MCVISVSNMPICALVFLSYIGVFSLFLLHVSNNVVIYIYQSVTKVVFLCQGYPEKTA